MSAGLWATVRVLASLLAVLMLVALAARAARRSSRWARGTELRVGERVVLTRDAVLAVVDLPDRRLLLGVTSHRVDVLGELPREQVEDTDAVTVHTLTGPAEASVPAQDGGVRVTPLPAGAESLLPYSRGGRRSGYRGATGAPHRRRGLRQTLETLRDLTARRG